MLTIESKNYTQRQDHKATVSLYFKDIECNGYNIRLYPTKPGAKNKYKAIITKFKSDKTTAIISYARAPHDYLHLLNSSIKFYETNKKLNDEANNLFIANMNDI